MMQLNYVLQNKTIISLQQSHYPPRIGCVNLPTARFTKPSDSLIICSIECPQSSSQLRVGRGLDAASGDHGSDSGDSVHGGPLVGGPAGGVDRVLQVRVVQKSRVLTLGGEGIQNRNKL